MEQIGPSSPSSDDRTSLKIKSEQLSSLKGAQSQVILSKSSTDDPYDTASLSLWQIEILSHLLTREGLFWQEWEEFIGLLNIPAVAIDDELLHTQQIRFRWPHVSLVLSLYNLSSHFSRRRLEDCLMVLNLNQYFEKEIKKIIRETPDWQGTRRKDKFTAAKTLTKPVRLPEKDFPSESNSYVSDTTRLSSLEILTLSKDIKKCEELAESLNIDLPEIFFRCGSRSLLEGRCCAARLLYIYSESGHFSRAKLNKCFEELGLHHVTETLVRMQPMSRDSQDESNALKHSDKHQVESVSNTTRLSVREIEELSLVIKDGYERLAELVKRSTGYPEEHWLWSPGSRRSRTARLLYIYSEGSNFSRDELAEYCEECGFHVKNISKRLQSYSMSSVSPDGCASNETRVEHPSSLKGSPDERKQQVYEADRIRLTDWEIDKLSRSGIKCKWRMLAVKLGIPSLVVLCDPHQRLYLVSPVRATRSLLSLYNHIGNFSRNRLEEICKELGFFHVVKELSRREHFNWRSSSDKESRDDWIISSDENETHQEPLIIHSAIDVQDESKMLKSIHISKQPRLSDKGADMCQIDQKTFQCMKARSLALRFMDSNPSCVRAIPYENGEDISGKPRINMCLYMNTSGMGITEDIREAAERIFADYSLTFYDLECKPLGEHVISRPTSDQTKTKDLANLAKLIEKNLSVFETRLNVTAVQPSYKIRKAQETNELCVAIFVLGKGKIPVGEKDFSEVEQLSNYPFDVVEGYYIPACQPFLSRVSPLHFGVGVGVKGCKGVGTLGAFLTDEKEDCYILSCQHVLKKELATSIEQPAEEDFITAKETLEKSIPRKENKIKVLETKRFGALNERERKNIDRQIRTAKRELEDQKERLKDLSDDGGPRHIATHAFGLQTNVHISDKVFFVDAAIAKVSDHEFNDIKSSIRGTVYGYDDEDTKPISGEIVHWDRCETEAETARFWKCGRTTGHTKGAQLQCRHFFLNREGFKKFACFGVFTHRNFETFCENCANEVKCDLVETSLLEERSCGKCERKISKEDKKRELWAYNCFTVLKKQTPFSDRGDSGSVIFDEEGRAWGIIIGSFETGHYFYTVAISLDIAIQALNQLSKRSLNLLCLKPTMQVDRGGFREDGCLPHQSLIPKLSLECF